MCTSSDYGRITQAISFIIFRVEDQPTLDEIAEHMNMSPFYFHRMVSQLVGVGPKRYLQVLTLQ